MDTCDMNNMFSLGKRALGGTFFRITEWMGETRFDLRYYNREAKDRWYPMEKGISMTIPVFHKLLTKLEDIDTALTEKKRFQFHLGEDIYCVIDQELLCVNIRKWRKPKKYWIPTHKGVSLTPDEYGKFKEAVKNLPEETLQELMMEDEDVLEQLASINEELSGESQSTTTG